ncbi:MAG: hypothetical protein HOQ28_08350 [Thermoleophilia bacterium]|nr:hypothetical protein [Thermoleophilia bacterium]
MARPLLTPLARRYRFPLAYAAAAAVVLAAFLYIVFRVALYVFGRLSPG